MSVGLESWSEESLCSRRGWFACETKVIFAHFSVFPLQVVRCWTQFGCRGLCSVAQSFQIPQLSVQPKMCSRRGGLKTPTQKENTAHSLRGCGDVRCQSWLSWKSGEREEKGFHFQLTPERRGDESRVCLSHPVEGNHGEFSVEIPKTLRVPGQQIQDSSLLPGAEHPSLPTALLQQVQSNFLLDLILCVLGACSPQPALALGSSWN